jgi:hypothetical protein
MNMGVDASLIAMQVISMSASTIKDAKDDGHLATPTSFPRSDSRRREMQYSGQRLNCIRKGNRGIPSIVIAEMGQETNRYALPLSGQREKAHNCVTSSYIK